MKVGDRVRSISEDCCNGHPVGTTGVVTRIGGYGIEVYGDTPYKADRLHLEHCEHCLEVIKDGQ